MDLKTVELEILKINEEFITYLDKINYESDDKTESILRDLNLKVDEKSTFIKALETKLIQEDEVFKSKINDFLIQLDNLTKSEKNLKYNLEEALIELQKQKAEELKPFLLHQKKKKTELTHKITAQRKELSFLHKDNNTKLIEEEKNFKNREVEFTRRMGIDLDRLNESNIKQYSDIEKSILEMEEEKLIKEAQKKINAIRLIGIKENLNIKNKYALQNYENALDYKRFQEKIILDNSILTEEFKQRVKTFEFEKDHLEDEEALKLALKDFDNELKMRDFERENELDQLEFEKEKENNKNLIHEDILNIRKEEHKLNYESVNKMNSEIYGFDKVQMTEFIMLDKYIIAADKKVIDNLISSLRNYILSYKELLIVSTEDYVNKRRSIFEGLINVLSSSRFGNIYESNSNYEDFESEFSLIIDDYLKVLNNSFSKFTSIIKTLVKNLEDQLNLTVMSIKTYWQENESMHNLLFNKFNSYFYDNFKDKDIKLKNLYEYNDEKSVNIRDKQKEEYNKELVEIKEKTKKIISEYNIKKRDILNKMEAYKNDLKLKQDKDKKDLNKFIKQSKFKINHYKKVYNENIAVHEKNEHALYKDALKQNKIEYKNRLESIEK